MHMHAHIYHTHTHTRLTYTHACTHTMVAVFWAPESGKIVAVVHLFLYKPR